MKYSLHKENNHNCIWYDIKNSPVILIKKTCNNVFEVFNGRITIYQGDNFNAAFKEFKSEYIRLREVL